MKKLIILLFVLLFLSGCAIKEVQSDKVIDGEIVTPIETVEDEERNDDLGDGEDVKSDSINSIEDRVNDIINNMTIEEKVAQLFIVDIYTFNELSNTTVMTESLKDKFYKYSVGGVIFFGSNIVDREQVKTFINDLQSTTKIPMFISVDEEGGSVRRLGNNEAMEMTEIPTASSIGDINDTEYAYEIGQILGTELSALGFNMNFAPVSDVNTNPDNPIIGDRAYGDNPEIVSEMIVPIIQGMQENDVAAVAKHFPGHGDTSFDTHTGDAYIEHNIERLRSIELVPFQSAIDADVMAIMSAHIIMENVTGHDKPSTLSKEIMTDLLRNEMNFDGLIITDALNMDAVSKRYAPGELCLEALNAGVDILLMPEDFDEAYIGVLEGIEKGLLSEERINESLRRILRTKMILEMIK